MKYEYFVSYTFKVGENTGLGCCDITTYQKIDSYAEVTSIMEVIKKKDNFDSVIIMNFILLKTKKNRAKTD